MKAAAWIAAFSITNAKLLEGIRETGSISAAARRVGMPYKKAWMLLDGMNQAFTEPVITAAPAAPGAAARA